MAPRVLLRTAGLLAVLAVGLSPAVSATAQSRSEQRDSSRWSFGTSLGFTAEPGGFQLSASLPYAFTRNFSVGPQVQLAVADDLVIVAPTANFQYAFDIPSGNEHVRRLRPFVQTGVGFGFIHKNRPVNDDEIGFLVNPGFGVEYAIRENIAIGTNMLFNILPVATTGENFFFTWQVSSLRFRF